MDPLAFAKINDLEAIIAERTDKQSFASDIEGEVILYGVIRQNGTVDSIQLVRGVDDRLNANAVDAFKEWKFEPATREGQPIDLEAIVHIPFHAPPRQ